MSQDTAIKKLPTLDLQSIGRRLALKAWRISRPVAWPVLLRLRAFFVTPLEHKLIHELDQKIGLLVQLLVEQERLSRDAIRALHREFSELRTSQAQFALRTHSLLDRTLHRQTSYAGDGITLCRLRGDVPLLVNAADLGLPARLVAGIDWEPENLDILLSYLRPDSVVLDLGANVGFFTVQLGRRLVDGHVFAVEPNPTLCTLLRRNLLINSLEHRVTVLQCAASDVAGEVELFYPDGAAGGGSLHLSAGGPGETLRVAARTLDESLPAGLRVDLIKLDVELHELAVLRGAADILSRSPDVVILMEKLDHMENDGEAILAFLREMGHGVYGVGPFAALVPLDDAAYLAWSGHIVSGRPSAIGDLKRSRITIYPEQLRGHGNKGVCGTHFAGDAGDTLFSGPCWSLAAGNWCIDVVGDFSGTLRLDLVDDRFDSVSEEGANRASFELSSETRGGLFFLPCDTDRLSLVGVALSSVALSLERITIHRAQ